MHSDPYFELNSALNNYFFDGKFAHRPVYLDLEGEAAEQVSQSLGIDPDDLGDYVSSIVTSTLTFEANNPYDQQVAWLKNWNNAGRVDPPPFTALLCAFSIAAERMSADEKFSANNYYARLFDQFDVSGTTVANKFKFHAKSTRQFWRALNIWLSERDHELGRPTARPVNHWPYASYGLSQALVRDADRQRFERLFEAMQFSPGEHLSAQEMMLYLNEWMSSASGPTTWLRKLWNVSDLRERVVAAALEELEAWVPARAESAVRPRKTRLIWSMGFTGFPSRRAVLALIARSPDGPEDLEIISVSDDVVRTALEGAGEALTLSETGGEDLVALGPTTEIDVCRLLLGSCEFRGKRTTKEYVFTAKPLVVLARSEDGTTFKEVHRAGLFEETAILCHHAWVDRAEGILKATARPGYTRLTSAEMNGVPTGWVVFRGVELVRPPEKIHDALQALNPIGGEATVSATGGLRLAPGIWHPLAPPIVEATSAREGSKLELVRERLGDEDSTLREVRATGDYMEIDLRELSPKAGLIIRAVVKKGRSELAEKTLTFRSSDVPRPMGKRVLYYPIVEGSLRWLGAMVAEGLPDSVSGLRGCTVHGELSRQNAIEDAADLTIRDVPSGVEEIVEQEAWKAVKGAEAEAPTSCVIRGYHYTQYDAFNDGDDRYDAKRGRCRDCGWETMSRSRERARQNFQAMREQAVVTPRQTRRVAKPSSAGGSDWAGGEVEPATLLDGLCHLGRGSV